MNKEEKIREQVRERYAAAIQSGSSCCGSNQSCGSNVLPADRVVSIAGYSQEELNSLPEDAVINSFGCGNPLAFAGVFPGEVVVDVGSGAGIDCLLAAEKVGSRGKVIGIDMTPAMIAKARQNAQKAGARNVDFRQGEAENMPIDNSEADWIISNCVINLSPNKPKVFREAFRVLKPGGKLSVSDIMVEKLPWILRRSKAVYTSCVAGAIPEREYILGLRQAGFDDVQVTERIVYDRDQIASFLQGSSLIQSALRWFEKPLLKILDRYIVGKVWSAKVVATKPRG